MPLIRLETSASMTDAQKQQLLGKLGDILADVTGKPKRYAMVVVQSAAISLAGKNDPAAFVDVRGIGGLTREVNQELSRRVCEFLQTVLGVEPDQVYLTFTDVPAANWGWNGKTFG